MDDGMRFEIYSGIFHPLRWYWQLRAANNRIIADGAESYSSKASCRKAINRLQNAISEAEGEVEIVEL